MNKRAPASRSRDNSGARIILLTNSPANLISTLELSSSYQPRCHPKKNTI